MNSFRSKFIHNMVSPHEAKVILKRFELAERNGSCSVDCYLAAIDSWLRLHPDVRREVAATCVVQVILDHRTRKIMDEAI